MNNASKQQPFSKTNKKEDCTSQHNTHKPPFSQFPDPPRIIPLSSLGVCVCVCVCVCHFFFLLPFKQTTSFFRNITTTIFYHQHRSGRIMKLKVFHAERELVGHTWTRRWMCSNFCLLNRLWEGGFSKTNKKEDCTSQHNTHKPPFSQFPDPPRIIPLSSLGVCVCVCVCVCHFFFLLPFKQTTSFFRNITTTIFYHQHRSGRIMKLKVFHAERELVGHTWTRRWMCSNFCLLNSPSPK